MIRADQLLALEEAQERLVDLVLKEVDPAEWVRDTSENRRDRLEQKRSAAQTLTLITKISSILTYTRGGGPMPTEPPDPADSGETVREASKKEIASAAQEAARLLKTYAGKSSE